MKITIAITSTCIFVSLFLLERFLPLRKPTRSLWRRLLVNLVVSALALVVAALLVQPLAAKVLNSDPA